MKILNMPPLGQLHEMSKEDLLHLQGSTVDAVTALASALVPGQFNESDNMLRLSGVAVVADTLAVNITGGWVYYAGKVYEVDPGTVNPGEGTAVANIAASYLEIYDAGSDAAYQDSAPFRVFSDFRMRLVVGDDLDRVPLTGLLDHIIQGIRGEVRSVALLSGMQASDIYDSGTGLGVNSWTGWALADGRNGTPNMNGRAIVGTGTQDGLDVGDNPIAYAPGQIFGKNRIQLTGPESGIKEHTVSKVLVADTDGDTSLSAPIWQGGSNGHIVNRTVPAQTADAAHYNVQPSIALIQMIKL